MLVLTRKQQEKIQIGDDIVITVLRTKGKTVRIGIEAPSTTPVLRGELAVRMEAENGTGCETAPQAPASNKPSHGLPQSRSNAKWNSGEADRSSTGRPSTSEPQVSLDRVPRSRVASVLPTVLGVSRFDETSPGPLRAMLDRRATSAI